MKMILIAMILIFAMSIAGCDPKEYCSVLDKRFSCQGSMDQSSYSIVFTNAPKGKFTIGRITIERSSEDSSGKRKDCSVAEGNIIEKGSEIKLTCRPEGPGRYTVNMKIYHQEPGSYSPAGGETCLKQNSMWNCDSSAFFAVNIR